MGKKLFVGNLNFKTTDDDLRTLFAQAGTIESATVMMDRATGRSRGFGFVEMSSDEEAEKAVKELNGHELQGRALNVNEARERTPGGPRPGGYGGGGGGGYGGGGGAPRGGGYGGGGGGGDRGYVGGGGPRDFNFAPSGGDDSGGFGGGFNRGNFKPRKEGGSRRGLRAKKRSL
jgi:RNA recognition motif-containing protein